LSATTHINELVDGFILAGGDSTRFGSDKSRYKVDGQPMILRIYNLLMKICGRVEAVVKGETDYGDLGITTIYDAYSVKAPINGIATALGHSSTEWSFIVACDLPELDLATLLRLWEHRAGAGVIPSVLGQLQPLIGLYNCNYEQMFKDAITFEQLKLHDIIHAIDFEILEFGDPDPFKNLNYRP